MNWLDLDQVCDAQPLAFLTGSILVLALLLLALALVIAWPLQGGRRRDDVMAQPHGDQPRLPAAERWRL